MQRREGYWVGGAPRKEWGGDSGARLMKDSKRGALSKAGDKEKMIRLGTEWPRVLCLCQEPQEGIPRERQLG